MGKRKKEALLIAEARERGFFDYSHKWEGTREERPICVELKYDKYKGLAYLYNKEDGSIIWRADKGWATVINPAKTKEQTIIEEATRRGFVIGAKHTGLHGNEEFEITRDLHFVFGCLYGGDHGCIYSGGNWATLITEGKKKPIFTTEDGVEMYGGEPYCMVWENNGWKLDYCHAGCALSPNTFRFSTKQAAQDWIEKQKPAAPKSLKPEDDSAEFLLDCKLERTKFVVEYWELFGDDAKARVWSENILIMYDQLVDRLSKLTINKTANEVQNQDHPL